MQSSVRGKTLYIMSFLSRVDMDRYNLMLAFNNKNNTVFLISKYYFAPLVGMLLYMKPMLVHQMWARLA